MQQTFQQGRKFDKDNKQTQIIISNSQVNQLCSKNQSFNVSSNKIIQKNKIKMKQQLNQDNILKIKNNQIIKHILKQSIHKLLHEFRSNNFNVNAIVKNVKIQFQKYALSQQSKKLEQLNNDDSENLQQKKQQYSYSQEIPYQIQQQVQIFIWHLSISPKYWITLLQNQTIFSTDTQIIDLHLFTSKIYKKVLEQSIKICKYSEIFFKITSDQIYFLLQEINIQICQLYQKGKQIIQKQVQQVTDIIKQSKMINFYIMFKVLIDISANCYQKITAELETGIFLHIQPSYGQMFAHYIIQKHQVLNMKVSDQQQRISQSQKQEQIINKIKNSNNIKWRQAIRQDGQIGILVEIQSQKQIKKLQQGQNQNNLKNSRKINQHYIVKLDQDGQIDIMNCNSVRLNWKVCKQKSENTNVLTLIQNKKKLAGKLRNVPTQIKNLTMLNNVTTIGGSLGKCLADINKYDSATDFMMDLSKGAAISGTFNYLIYNIPLIGYLFVTGGYTYSFYSIFSNKYSTFEKKFQQMGNLTIDTASSFGSGFLGAFIGQTLIPVPVVGAFIGGLVGGFIGQIGGKKLSNYLQNSRFTKTIQGLKRVIKPGGYWDATHQTLQCLNIKQQKFFNTIPSQLQKRMNCDRLWLTLICFTLYSFYESKQRKKYMLKSMQKLKKQQEKIQYFDISFEEYKKEYEYIPSLDMQCITKFLSNQRVQYISCIKQIQEFMDFMYSRVA